MFFQKRPVFLILAFPALFLLACASPKSITGGPVDDTPPMILEDESTPNQQTNFKEKEIIITFDEWITLKDAFSQLIISPLMPRQPEIKQKGKTILISLPDSLKEETTYTINFGNAIADLNEGNVLENYAFVFSTGAVLDSNKLSGKVINAATLAPADGIWVMLYPVGEDSAVYKRKPEYVAKTNKEGKWNMANIRADSFSVLALKDENLNFLYDLETELIGWIDYTIYILSPNSVLPQIQVFPKEKRTVIRDIIHPVPGWIKIIEDAPLPKPVPELLPPLEGTVTAWEKDTLHIWYSPDKNYSGSALLLDDTTRIRKSESPSPLSTTLPISLVPGRLNPKSAARFSTAVPFTKIDTSRILVVHDSLGVMPFTLATDSLNNRIVEISARWKTTDRQVITFLPGAVTDIWGRMNDTIRRTIVVIPEDQFGDLTLNVDGLDSTRQYLLLVKSGEQVAAHFQIQQLTDTQIKKQGLAPGKYVVELIEDLNSNGAWDTGDYPARRQPERKMIFTLETMRAAWELEAKLSWK